MITKTFIEQLFAKFNITIPIKDLNLYKQAMVHESFVSYNECNQRLEFLGDSALRLIISEYLYVRYQYENEGYLTKLKSKIENKKMLSNFSKILEIDQFLMIQNIENITDSVLEDLFESFVGALYLDLGLNVCKQFIVSILETSIDYSELLYKNTNFKDQLMQFYHKHKNQSPQYKLLEIINKKGKKIFKSAVINNDEICEIGYGYTKQDSEHMASMKLLYKFNIIKDDQLVEEISLT